MKNYQHIFTSASILFAFTLITPSTFAANFNGTITYQGEKIPVFELNEVEINYDEPSVGNLELILKSSSTNTFNESIKTTDNEPIKYNTRKTGSITSDIIQSTAEPQIIPAKSSDNTNEEINQKSENKEMDTLKKRPAFHYYANKAWEIGSLILHTIYDGLFFRS